MATVRKRTQFRKDSNGLPDLERPYDPTWVTAWRDPDGKPHTRTFRTQKEANAERNRIGRDLDTGTYLDVTRGRVTVERYGEEWRKVLVHRDRSREQLELNLRLHVYPTFGARPLGTIRKTEVMAWVKALSETMAPNTVRGVLGNLAALMAAAVEDEAIRSNPCVKVKVPGMGARPEVVPPSLAAVQAHIDGGGRYRVAMVLGAAAGLRSGEVRGLTVDRVDFLRRTIRVDRQAVEVTGAGIRFGPPKTVQSVRTIPVDEAVIGELSAHIGRYGLGAEGSFLHSARTGAMVSSQMLRWAMGRTRPDRSLPVKFHGLRHYYVSSLLQARVDIKDVQARTGIATAAIVFDTYGHLMPKDSLDRVAGIADLFGEG